MREIDLEDFERIIRRLYAGWPAASIVTDDQLENLSRVLKAYPIELIEQACDQVANRQKVVPVPAHIREACDRIQSERDGDGQQGPPRCAWAIPEGRCRNVGHYPVDSKTPDGPRYCEAHKYAKSESDAAAIVHRQLRGDPLGHERPPWNDALVIEQMLRAYPRDMAVASYGAAPVAIIEALAEKPGGVRAAYGMEPATGGQGGGAQRLRHDGSTAPVRPAIGSGR